MYHTCTHDSYIVLLLFILRADHHSLPRAYVTCHPHPSVPKLSTPISVETIDPHWEYTLVLLMSSHHSWRQDCVH